MMTNVVERGHRRGLPRSAASSFAGKTGTAEIDVDERLNQAWFIGFAPVDDPQIAIAVTVERSTGAGGDTAGADRNAGACRSSLSELMNDSSAGQDGRRRPLHARCAGSARAAWPTSAWPRTPSSAARSRSSAARALRPGPGVRRALPARGLVGRRAPAPEHRRRLRPRRATTARYYIAMEYVDGASLKDLIDRGPDRSPRRDRVHPPDPRRRRVRPRARHRPPRPEAAQRARRRRRPGRGSPTSASPARAARRSPQTGSVMGTAQYLSPGAGPGART